ncbi:MAG: sugar ABC transporter permease [Oscillospiraceae bacterium]|jgi:multiple sugar transport system permease protein|nr:sugar ABC transporter permease [Oscillospiraceae bacterium]
MIRMLRRAKPRAVSFLYLLPSLAGVLTFFIVPFAQIIRYSLVDNPISNTYVGFDNFKRLFANAAFQRAASNTIRFSAIAMPLAVVLSLLLAMVLEAKIPGKSKFRTMFLSPMMVPVASIVLIWQVLFDYNGVLNNVFARFGVLPIDWFKSDYSHLIVVALFLWKNLGYNMILFMAALGNIPKALVEAASVDGASSFRRFWQIKFRFLSPTFLFVTILSLINSFKVFREVYLLTGDYPYEDLYLLQHFMNNTFKSLDYQKLSAAALIMAVVMALIIGILFIVDGRLGKDVES